MIITFNSLLSLEKQNLSFLQHQDGFHLIVSAVHGIFQYPVHVYAIYLFIIVCCEYCKNNVNLFLGVFFHENDIILL